MEDAYYAKRLAIDDALTSMVIAIGGIELVSGLICVRS